MIPTIIQIILCFAFIIMLIWTFSPKRNKEFKKASTEILENNDDYLIPNEKKEQKSDKILKNYKSQINKSQNQKDKK